MQWKHILILVMVTLMAAPASIGQAFKAEAYTDTNAILIGDQVTLTLSVSNPFGKQVLWPEIGDTIVAGVEVLEHTVSDTLKRQGDGTLEIVRNYKITSFDSGYFVIPPFRFTDAADSGSFAETEAILIEVHTLEVDTTQAIKDVKAPYEVPYTWDEFIPHGIAVLAIILLSIAGYWLYRKYRNRPVKVIPVPVVIRDPQEVALEHLHALEEKKLWQQNKVKPFYTELTDIVRTYIEQRFEIIAMEMTTEEILAALNYVMITAAAREKLHQLLTVADMVKFAKAQPVASEHELCLANAYLFVRDAVHVPAPPGTGEHQSINQQA